MRARRVGTARARRLMQLKATLDPYRIFPRPTLRRLTVSPILTRKRASISPNTSTTRLATIDHPVRACTSNQHTTARPPLFRLHSPTGVHDPHQPGGA